MKRTHVLILLSCCFLFLCSACKKDPLAFRAGETKGDHFVYQGSPQYCLDPGGDTFLSCDFDIIGDGEEDLRVDLGGQYFQGQLIRSCRVEARRGVDLSMESIVGGDVRAHLLAEGEDLLEGQNWYENEGGFYVYGWSQGVQTIGLRWGQDPYAYAWVKFEVEGCTWTFMEWAFMP